MRQHWTHLGRFPIPYCATGEARSFPELHINHNKKERQQENVKCSKIGCISYWKIPNVSGSISYPFFSFFAIFVVSVFLCFLLQCSFRHRSKRTCWNKIKIFTHAYQIENAFLKIEIIILRYRTFINVISPKPYETTMAWDYIQVWVCPDDH